MSDEKHLNIGPQILINSNFINDSAIKKDTPDKKSQNMMHVEMMKFNDN